MMNYHSYSGSSAPADAPDAYRLDIPKVAIDNLLTPSERHKWISEAAYFISERGGFAPGRELSDWREVVAPTLVPVKAGDRVKADRRDAEKLARCYRAGDLTVVWVPDAAHEALRDLVRARLAAKRDQLRARNRLSKFLLRHGRRPPEGCTTAAA